MFLKNLEVLSMARGLARHAAAAQSLTARNIANADTPGYRAGRLEDFSKVWTSSAQPLRVTRPQHVGGASTVDAGRQVELRHDSPNRNSVSVEAEIMQSARNRQMHDMALGINSTLSGVIRQTLSRR